MKAKDYAPAIVTEVPLAQGGTLVVIQNPVQGAASTRAMMGLAALVEMTEAALDAKGGILIRYIRNGRPSFWAMTGPELDELVELNFVSLDIEAGMDKIKVTARGVYWTRKWMKIVVKKMHRDTTFRMAMNLVSAIPEGYGTTIGELEDAENGREPGTVGSDTTDAQFR